MELKLKELRTALRLSQGDISQVTSIPQPTLSSLENNPVYVENASLKTLITLADYFSIGLDELLDFHSEDRQPADAGINISDSLKRSIFFCKQQLSEGVTAFEKVVNDKTSDLFRQYVNNLNASLNNINPQIVVVGRSASGRASFVRSLLGRKFCQNCVPAETGGLTVYMHQKYLSQSQEDADHMLLIDKKHLALSNLEALKAACLKNGTGKDTDSILQGNGTAADTEDKPVGSKKQSNSKVREIYTEASLLEFCDIIDLSEDVPNAVIRMLSNPSSLFLYVSPAGFCTEAEDISFYDSFQTDDRYVIHILSDIDYYSESALEKIRQDLIRRLPGDPNENGNEKENENGSDSSDDTNCDDIQVFSKKNADKNAVFCNSVETWISNVWRYYMKSRVYNLTNCMNTIKLTSENIGRGGRLLPLSYQNLKTKMISIFNSQLEKGLAEFNQYYEDNFSTTESLSSWLDSYKKKAQLRSVSSEETKLLLKAIFKDLEDKATDIMRQINLQYEKSVNEEEDKHRKSRKDPSGATASNDLISDLLSSDILSSALLGPSISAACMLLAPSLAIPAASIFLGLTTGTKMQKEKENKLLKDINKILKENYIQDTYNEYIRSYVSQLIQEKSQVIDTMMNALQEDNYRQLQVQLKRFRVALNYLTTFQEDIC